MPKDFTAQDEKGFRAYLRQKKGCAPTTVDLYVTHVKSCVNDANGILERLVSDLAPKTKRAIKASLLAWARYREDTKLEKEIKEIKLPAAHRINIKEPLTSEEWHKFRTAIEQSDYNTPLKAVLGIIINRGLRVGDVLNITREKAVTAIETNRLSVETKGDKWVVFGVLLSFKDYLQMLVNIPDWKAVSDLLSTSKDINKRKKAARLTVWRAVKQLSKKVGLDPKKVSPHRFRRTIAVEFLKHPQVNGNLELLRKYMNWSSIQIAQTYIDSIDQEQLDEIGETL
jgi:integrase/recombinase XerD